MENFFYSFEKKPETKSRFPYERMLTILRFLLKKINPENLSLYNVPLDIHLLIKLILRINDELNSEEVNENYLESMFGDEELRNFLQEMQRAEIHLDLAIDFQNFLEKYLKELEERQAGGSDFTREEIQLLNRLFQQHQQSR